MHSGLKCLCFCLFKTTRITFSGQNKKRLLRSDSVIGLQCERMHQNTVHVIVVICNPTPKPQAVRRIFITLALHTLALLGGRVMSTQKSVTSPSPVELGVAFRLTEGWHGPESCCCRADEALRPLLKPPLAETRGFKLRRKTIWPFGT